MELGVEEGVGWLPVVYAVASFLLVLAAALLAYVACSRRYRLNWFERNLLESEELKYSSKEALIVSGGEDGGSTAGVGSSRSLNKSPSCDKFWVPPNLKRQSSLENSSPEESGVGSPVSGDVTIGTSIVETPSKIERVQQQVVLASARPRVNSMHRQLDHTKIDAALYDQQMTSHGATDEGGDDIIRGSVNLTLVYDPHAGILTVRLIQAVDLQPRDFSGTADPYAKIRLLPDRTNVWQTRIHKKTLNPVFDEDFVFEVRRGGVGLVRRTLELVLYDFDAYSRHHSIGCVQLPLAGLDLDQKLTLWKALSPCLAHHDQAKEELGEVLISLSFLPSAERLTVVVIKARNLRAIDETRASSDPYVKVSLWVNGRRYKRKKTSVARNTVRPVFNEALTFDIGRDALAHCRLEVTVLHAGGGPAATGEPLGSSCLSSDTDRRLFHDLLSTKAGQAALTRWLPLTDPD